MVEGGATERKRAWPTPSGAMAQGGLKKRSEKFSLASKPKSSKRERPLGPRKGGKSCGAAAKQPGRQVARGPAMTTWYPLYSAGQYIAPKKGKKVKAEKLKKVIRCSPARGVCIHRLVGVVVKEVPPCM